MAQLISSPTSVKNKHREILAWAMYDWAFSGYSAISITVLVVYLQTTVLPDEAGVRVWGWGIGVTMMVAAVLSPILGAIADAHANKRTWLLWTTLLGSGASALMFFATPDRAVLFVLLFLVANLSYELAQTFYNGFLPEITDNEHMGRVSALGYGCGYAGAACVLIISLTLIHYGDALGLPQADGFRARLSLTLVGIWWAIFSLPILLIVRDRSRAVAARQSVLIAARQGLREVAATIRRIRSYRMLSMFLLGFLIFNDGVQTLFSQTSVFAEKVLHLQMDKLALVILMIQCIALPGALLVGQLADRIGQKAALNLCLAVWVAVLSGAFFISQEWHFWIMAAATALVLGGTQSVSRTIVGLMTPESRSGEFFGFFNLSGKAFGIVGPIFFSEILIHTGSPHWAILGLLLFFLVGWAVIVPLDIGVGQREAREELDAGR